MPAKPEKNERYFATSKRDCGSREFVLGVNTLHLTCYLSNTITDSSYFMVRQSVRKAVLEARTLTVSCFFNNYQGETSFTIGFYPGTNIIQNIGCQLFTKTEGRKLSRWATYGEIKIGALADQTYTGFTQV